MMVVFKITPATRPPFSEALFQSALKWIWRAETTDKTYETTKTVLVGALLVI